MARKSESVHLDQCEVKSWLTKQAPELVLLSRNKQQQAASWPAVAQLDRMTSGPRAQTGLQNPDPLTGLEFAMAAIRIETLQRLEMRLATEKESDVHIIAAGSFERFAVDPL